MVLTVYGFVPAWDLPDISPFVTKLIFFLKMTGTPYKYQAENLAKLEVNAPCGKLPYIIDDDGTKASLWTLTLGLYQLTIAGQRLERDYQLPRGQIRHNAGQELVTV